MIGELSVRPERPGDEDGIARVVNAAFGQTAEGDLVARLRDRGALAVSLVAEAGGNVVGHVALSPVTINGRAGGGRWLGLAPLAVDPNRQRRGVGRRLAAAALDAAARGDGAVVFVLGDSHYYGALGFEEAIRFGWRCTYDVPSAAFRVRLLGSPAAEDLPPVGTVRYHEAFDGL
ncbi:MAG TPA: N-acetyltransferase [Geminicoccaceae bacterium]|nr:N-acetyltransferase [Geminicoccaceae bacterium]